MALEHNVGPVRHRGASRASQLIEGKLGPIDLEAVLLGLRGNVDRFENADGPHGRLEIRFASHIDQHGHRGSQGRRQFLGGGLSHGKVRAFQSACRLRQGRTCRGVWRRRIGSRRGGHGRGNCAAAERTKSETNEKTIRRTVMRVLADKPRRFRAALGKSP